MNHHDSGFLHDPVRKDPLVERALELLLASGRESGAQTGEDQVSLTLRCRGCAQKVLELYRIGRCWRCLECASLPAGMHVWWQSMNNTTRGPAAVEGHGLDEDGHLWVKLRDRSQEYEVRDALITDVRQEGAGKELPEPDRVSLRRTCWWARPTLPDLCQVCKREGRLVWSVPQDQWVCFWCFDNDLREVTHAPQDGSPVQSGWLVVYRDQTGRLRGGDDERECGTVESVELGQDGWIIKLTDGTVLPEQSVRAVAATDPQGRVLAAWEVKNQG